jgi:hypothetical protein
MIEDWRQMYCTPVGSWSASPSPSSTVVSKSVANPWRDPKIALLAGQKAVKKWIR